MMKKKFFAFLDQSLISFVPQPIQHEIVSRMAELQHGQIHFYSLENPETINHLQILNSKIEENSVLDGFIFFSIYQFVKNNNLNFVMLNKILNYGYEVHFSAERLSYHNTRDL